MKKIKLLFASLLLIALVLITTTPTRAMENPFPGQIADTVPFMICECPHYIWSNCGCRWIS